VEQTAFRSRACTYDEVAGGVRRMAAALRASNVYEGDRVVLWSENSAQWAMMFYACVLLRIVVVPMDPSFSAAFVERIRVLTGARRVFTGADLAAARAEQHPAKLVTPAPAPESALLEIIYTSEPPATPRA